MIGALGSPIRLTKEHFLVIFDFVVARGRYISTNGFFHKFSGYQRSLARPESALATMTLLEVIVQLSRTTIAAASIAIAAALTASINQRQHR